MAIDRVTVKNRGYEHFYGKFHAGDSHEWSQERWYPHLIGILGEMAYSKVTGHSVDRSLSPKGDRGEDFIDGTEVKTRMTKEWEMGDPLLLVRQEDYKRKKPRRYVLMELRNFFRGTTDPHVVFKGEVGYEEFGKKAKEMRYPGRVNLGMRSSKLSPFAACRKY